MTKHYSVQHIKTIANNFGSHFFDRDTMKFFGDRMTSFGSKEWRGDTILYRKPNATVNVFGNRQRAGKEFFSAWRFNPDTGALDILSDEEKSEFWNEV